MLTDSGRVSAHGVGVPGVGVLGVRVEVLGDQEAARPLGVRVAVHELVVRGAVVRDEEVGELVDEHVVEDPRRERREPRRTRGCVRSSGVHDPQREVC